MQFAIGVALTLGIALVIALQQLPLVFEVDRGEGTESLLVTWNTLGNIISQPVHWNSLIVVAGTLLVQFGWGRWQNLGAFRLRIPPSAVAVLVVSLVLQGISDLIKSANILTGRLQAAEVQHG